MELKAFLTYPGLHSLDDAHVLYSDGMAVDYPRLHNEIGESAFQVCQNYPSQLLKMGICDAPKYTTVIVDSNIGNLSGSLERC